MKRITLLTLRARKIFDRLKLCSTFYLMYLCFSKNIVYLCSKECGPLRKGNLT